MIPCVETQHWFRPTIENVMLHQTQWAVSCVWVCDQSQSIDCTVEYVYILCYSGDCDVGVCMCVCVWARDCVSVPVAELSANHRVYHCAVRDSEQWTQTQLTGSRDSDSVCWLPANRQLYVSHSCVMSSGHPDVCITDQHVLQKLLPSGVKRNCTWLSTSLCQCC